VVDSDRFTFVGGLEMLGAYAMAAGGVRASRRLFLCFYTVLLRAPMLFFDTTPRGRILNRVAEDISCIDRVMPFTVRSMSNCILGTFASIFVIAYTTPRFLISLPVLVVVYYYIQVKCCHISAAKLLHVNYVNAQALALFSCLAYEYLHSCLSGRWL